jgi:hypothetical protein
MTMLPDRYVPKSLRPLQVDPATITKSYGMGQHHGGGGIGMVEGPDTNLQRILDIDPSAFTCIVSIIEFTEGTDDKGNRVVLSDRELYRWNRGARAWIARAAKPAPKSWNDTATLAIKGALLGELTSLPPAMAGEIAAKCSDAAISALMKAAGLVDLERCKPQTQQLNDGEG